MLNVVSKDLRIVADQGVELIGPWGAKKAK